MAARLALLMRIGFAVAAIATAIAFLLSGTVREEYRWLLAVFSGGLLASAVASNGLRRRDGPGALRVIAASPGERANAASRIGRRPQQDRGRPGVSSNRNGLERTASGPEGALIEAKLRQLEHRRGDYAAAISHELKTPLTSIKGFAQLLLRGQEVPSETAVRYAATINSEADRLARIIDDIVDLARMETSLLRLRHERLNPARLTEHVVGQLGDLVESGRLVMKLEERTPQVYGDPDRLQQVLTRLILDALSNARAAVPMRLELRSSGNEAVVSLEYETTQERIDHLVAALDGPNGDGSIDRSTRLGEGQLWTYISRNFIEAHGGRLWVEIPRPDVARVVFTLPY